ncbi:MAG: DUF427 domain-containing protein [Acidimicrobiia bacterium]
MAKIESAWHKYPEYVIELKPAPGLTRVWLGDTLIAETSRAVLLEETKHVDRLYIPEGDLKWEYYAETDLHTICPFKGECDYWTVTTPDGTVENVVWAYRDPFPEVAGIKGLVCFYQDRVRIEITDESGETRPFTSREWTPFTPEDWKK